MPGTYAENAREAKRLRASPPWNAVSGMELLFFMLDEETERTFLAERDELLDLWNDGSFSVHLPGNLNESHERLVIATKDFAVNYVMHPPASDIPAFARLMDSWRNRHGDIFCLENTIMGPFRETLAAIPDIPICVDSGHALLTGQDPAALLEEFWPRLREIHFHGVQGGKDHVPPLPEDTWLATFMTLLARFDGIVEIELFSKPEIERALSLLENLQ